MIVVDINLLVHAYNHDFADHHAAREWWEATLNGREMVGLPYVSLLGFIRLVTHRSVMKRPLSVELAVAAVESWLAQPSVELLNPEANHPRVLFGLLRALGVGGNLTTDAHLAALAIEHQGRLASTDADFARFEGLRWFNPLKKR